jgi:hypothetical protein
VILFTESILMPNGLLSSPVLLAWHPDQRLAVPQPAIRRTAYRYRISSRYQLRNFITLKATSSSTGGVISVMEIQTSGGSAPYAHSREDESFYILEGAIRVLCEDQVFIASARSFVFLAAWKDSRMACGRSPSDSPRNYDAGGS